MSRDHLHATNTHRLARFSCPQQERSLHNEVDHILSFDVRRNLPRFEYCESSIAWSRLRGAFCHGECRRMQITQFMAQVSWSGWWSGWATFCAYCRGMEMFMSSGLKGIGPSLRCTSRDGRPESSRAVAKGTTSSMSILVWDAIWWITWVGVVLQRQRLV